VITKYKTYLDTINNSVETLRDLSTYVLKMKKFKKQNIKEREVFIDKLISDYTDELSKYFKVIKRDDVRRECDANIDINQPYNNNEYGGFKIKHIFMIDDDYGFILVPPDVKEYVLDADKFDSSRASDYTVSVFKIYKKGYSFIIRRTSFYVFRPKIDIEQDVKTFYDLYSKSIKPSQKKRDFKNQIDKYNL